MSQTNPFPYYVGINSLEEIANKDTRCVVMNILGGESKGVTPTSHEFSGGNVVAGVQYGRSGEKMETKAGDIRFMGVSERYWTRELSLIQELYTYLLPL